MSLGAFFEVILAIGNISTAVTLFPILKRPILVVAVDAPELVSSLALFEPSALAVMNPEQVVEAIWRSTWRGDRVAAVSEHFTVVSGPEWRAEVSRTILAHPMQSYRVVWTRLVT